MIRTVRSLALVLLVAAFGGISAGVAGPGDDDPFADSNAATATPKTAGEPVPVDKTADLLQLEAKIEPAEAKPGQVVRLTIAGSLKPGYHTYPITKRTPTQDEVALTKLAYPASPMLHPLWPLTESEPVARDSEVEGIWLEHESRVTWSQDVLVDPAASPGKATLRAKLDLQVCNAQHCVRGVRFVDASVTVLAEPAVALNPDLQKRLAENQPAPDVTTVAPADGSPAAAPARGHSGLIAFILQGVFWGAVSLVTPCVFPMIPITVSYFLKQSEKEHHRPIAMAAVYCATIVTVLTVSAVALLSFFTKISTHPVTNYGLGALFVFFALSLFGMYEIELPSGLARFTSAREGRGGMIGTMFMALTFTIISFACVAPFMGGFSGTAAGAGLGFGHRVFGGLAFAATFASPFFILALFPTLLKRLPKSGTWLNSVKVVMGFLELAAALKFFRAGELVSSETPTVFTYDLVLGAYVALCAVCALYLLNVYRLPHDTQIEHLGVPRLIVGVAFLTLGLYLLPALFKSGDHGSNQRPNGVVFAWLDSFLLPEPVDAGAATDKVGDKGAGSSELAWHGTLRGGIDDALKDGNRLVFVDFTGKTCTNCSWNERNVFSRSDIRNLLGRYSLVQLYTDLVPNRLYRPDEVAAFGSDTSRQKTDAEANRDFENKRFNTSQLPLYLILRPRSDGGYDEIARYDEGKINDVNAFTQFLRQPLAGELRAQATARN
jgi:thiol:disulfide interchange protein DsbD